MSYFDSENFLSSKTSTLTKVVEKYNDSHDRKTHDVEPIVGLGEVQMVSKKEMHYITAFFHAEKSFGRFNIQKRKSD